MDEPAQQRITYLLQEIDANICAAHRSATQICATVRRHHQILRQIHASSRVWRPLFDSFTQPPAVRRVTRTPSRFSRPLTPMSSGDDAATRREGGTADRGGDVDNMDVDMDDDCDVDESSFVSREQTFKTTTLKKLKPRSSDRRNVSADEDSLDASINSDNLPRMSRTPYMSKAAVQSTVKTQHSTSTLNSSDHGRWSPRMTSPPRTGVVSREQMTTATAGDRVITTPPSAISSVECRTSPGISRNLMKMGAFEYTPPRGTRASAIANSEAKEGGDWTSDSIETPSSPDFSTVRLSIAARDEGQVTEKGASPLRLRSSPAKEDVASRKRSRSSSARKKERTPAVYPKTRYPAKATSPFTSPSLRRKYSSRSSLSSGYQSTHMERQTPVAATPPRQRDEAFMDDDTPSTPEFDLASPLLRTQLKAMTPNTPLSNRLVGASFDVGSVSQETRLHDYDDSVSAGEPTPKFELSLLPAAFQRGIGAVQVSTLYSKFQGADDDTPAISVDHLMDMLPDYGKEKIEILVDTLVSRRLLRPFVVEGTMFWQKAT
ncbi:unnamed protein product [Hyaloperonospora brassicae]|uniref:DASH complex subunit ASK1 n=1 Tax=Hyaloperonospora brassicae TaxID=162125 RepID=A0AAV0UCF5_HYABA|nr:unnamed protein product [Hyaloperonospora brassicae]